MSELIIYDDIKQGSPEWHALRRLRRPASVTPMVMGTSKWSDIGDAYDVLQGDSEFRGNIATDHGVRMEPIARRKFIELHGPGTAPIGVRGEYLASLDYRRHDGSIVTDIKCPFSGAKGETWKAALRNEIEPGYSDQLEHQYRVFRPERIGLFVYISDRQWCWVEYQPSDKRWGEIERAWDKFWRDHIETFTRPEVYAQRTDPDWNAAATRFANLQLDLIAREEQVAKAREKLIELAGGQKCEGFGVRVNTFTKRGSIDYKAALASVEPEFDAEPFRKAPSTVTQVNLIGSKK